MVLELSLQHGADGEPWRKAGGEVFEGVDHQVDPGGTDRKESHRPSVPTSEALKSKRFLKRWDDGEEHRDTHSFLSKAFSSSLVNRLFSPICKKKRV